MIGGNRRGTGDNMIGGSAPDRPQVPGGGTLTIRTWIEYDDESGFRARVTYSDGAGQRSIATVDREEVLQVVRQWLSAREG